MKPTQFLFTLVLVFCLCLGWAKFTRAETDIPEALRPCIPATVWRYRIGTVEAIAQTRYQNVDYYLFHLYPENSQPFTPEALRFPHIISSANQVCEVVYSNPSNDEHWMSDSVPQPVANQLTLARYRFFINEEGLEQFKQRNLPYYQQSQAPEVQWALQQLGLIDTP
jgi:hypothetical protein